MRQIFLALCLLTASTTDAAYSQYSKSQETSATLRELLVALEDLKHEVKNHETELRTFEEKSRSYDDILETLRNQQAESLQAMRESIKNQEAKLSGQENASKGLSTTLQNHASDSVAALSDYKKRILELEKTVELQNKNIENLQTALKAVMDALQTKDSPQIASNEATKIYRVKAGDSLERIARHHQTTIKKLKELNNLTSDQIIVGQKLQLPE